MEQIIASGGLLLLLTSACILSWILGDANGARRMQLLVFAAEPGAGPAMRGSGGARTAHWADPTGRSVRPAQTPQPVLQPLPSHDFDIARCSEPLRPARLRDTFSNMPTLDELEAQAEAIRSETRIWDDPELCAELRSANPQAGKVLNHYGRSIDALQQANGTSSVGGPQDDRDPEFVELAAMPRFADAAPPLPAELARADRTRRASR